MNSSSTVSVLDLSQDYKRALKRLNHLEKYHKWQASNESRREEKELRQFIAVVDGLIDLLPLDQQDVINLTVLGDYRVADICDQIGYSRTQAYEKRSNGIANLAAIVEKGKTVQTPTGKIIKDLIKLILKEQSTA